MSKYPAIVFTRNDKLSTDDLIWKKTFVSFFLFFLAIGLGIGGWVWLHNQPREDSSDKSLLVPFRKVLDLNSKIFGTILSDNHLSKTYPKSAAERGARVNGNIGMMGNFDVAAWKMSVIKADGDTLQITLDDLKKLPRTEVVFNFKCIEGWSQITYWAGVKFSDFIKAYHLEKEASLRYLGLATPDKQYYVGIDMASALHPQTILCYELDGKPLPMNQGYPLRLIIPVKYGVKSLKRIGTMVFDDVRPKDYWAEKGYDYFTGL
jgi:hypothetical protein